MSNPNESDPGETWTPGHVLYYGPNTRTVSLFGSIDKDLSLVVISQLLELNEHSQETIFLHINTDGGLLGDAFAIYDCIRTIESPVVITAMGVCASAGLLVLAAGDLKLATENCLFFYHQTTIPPEAVSSLEQIQETHLAYQAYQEKYDEIIRTKSKMTKPKYRKAFLGKTSKYFFSEEAESYGIIDDIIPTNNKVYVVKLEEEWQAEA